MPKSKIFAAGFSLVELFIVMSIVGILATMAIPNFTKAVAKAKQGEARTTLRAIAGALKAHYAESSDYRCGLCGFHGDAGGAYLYTYFTTTEPTPANSLGGGLARNGCNNIADALQFAQPVQTKETFKVVAVGNIDGDADCDVWSIDEELYLHNDFSDLVGR